ncbi:molybdopterin converting factor subunit 1 [Marinimicrobium sp. ARAG 43.8]|uniref:molybdopterin converting factor subunit 1 n=1 Tax=Marinimicrobium sp. ARAG 43.8 TaxID=3418719 RepID=UPI003CE8F0A4
MIDVLFFARLREELQCDRTQLEAVAQDTVTNIRERLIALNPQWREPLSRAGILFAVNQTLVSSEHSVHDGDEVAFMPPVTGG